MRQASPLNNHPLWRDGIDPLRFPALDGDKDYDIVIIGGGFSGLWSAYHLLTIDPSLRICIVEGEEIGFGASGRNGGWVSADYPVDTSTLALRYPERDIQGFTELLVHGVDEIGEISAAIAPRARFRKAGSLSFATHPLQFERLQGLVDQRHHLLSREETQSKVAIPSALGGLFTVDCATINPRGLLIDLAGYLQSQGVDIYERSFATHYDDGPSINDGGLWVNGFRVKAPWKILATEAFTPKSREQIPLYSLMIATRPLSSDEKAVLGWTPGLAIAEATHNVNYAQFSSEFRIALGGRGARYPFAGRLDTRLEGDTRTHRHLSQLIERWFPQLSGAEGDTAIEITHQWGGSIAIRRNWESFVCVDKLKGIARLGGYVGDGLTMSFVAARAVAIEILTGVKPLANMPISTDCSKVRKWPIEPLRYLGANALISGIERMDVSEEAGRASPWGSFLRRLMGK